MKTANMSQSSINFSLQFEKGINEIFDEFFGIIDNRKNVTCKNDYVKELLTDCQAKCLNYVKSVFNLCNDDMSTNTLVNQNASTSQILLQQNITTNSTVNKDEKNEPKSSGENLIIERIEKLENMVSKLYDRKRPPKQNDNKSVRKSDMTVCHNCSQPGHISRNCRKTKKKCYNCSKFGHVSKFCRFNLNQHVELSKNSTRKFNVQTRENAKNYITWNDVNRLKSFLGQQTFQPMVISSQYPYQHQIPNSQITQSQFQI
jgi:hypothetical protein